MDSFHHVRQRKEPEHPVAGSVDLIRQPYRSRGRTLRNNKKDGKKAE